MAILVVEFQAWDTKLVGFLTKNEQYFFFFWNGIMTRLEKSGNLDFQHQIV